MDDNPPDSSVHGILQTRTLKWAAMPSLMGSSWPRDQTCVSWIAGRFFTAEPPGSHPTLAPSPGSAKKKKKIVFRKSINRISSVSGQACSGEPWHCNRKAVHSSPVGGVESTGMVCWIIKNRAWWCLNATKNVDLHWVDDKYYKYVRSYSSPIILIFLQ